MEMPSLPSYVELGMTQMITIYLLYKLFFNLNIIFKIKNKLILNILIKILQYNYLKKF